MAEIRKKVKRKARWKLLHQYYSYTGFYIFLGRNMKKAIPPIVIFIVAILCIHFFVIDINTVLEYIINNFPDYAIFLTFLISESILGLIPPEIFIAWSGKSISPWVYLSILATSSYIGGIVSYVFGRGVRRIPSVYDYLEGKMEKNIKNMRKWGGFLIVVGALLPLPFAISSIASGIIKYPLGSYLLFGLLRFLRFAIYGTMIFKLV